MTKVLWFSRHPMQEAQETALRKSLGDMVITQLSKSIQSAQDISQEIESHDVIAVVAPPQLLAGILRIAGDKPVITAKMERKVLPDGSVEMRFIKWERVLRIVVEKEDF
ncbi:hypothetical protein [Anaerovibrio sp.]|uniref:hypothetical protein n=1 Tax=Anaerovibrio sp. TaxID=1872532 RepID=UPI003F16743D